MDGIEVVMAPAGTRRAGYRTDAGAGRDDTDWSYSRCL